MNRLLLLSMIVGMLCIACMLCVSPPSNDDSKARSDGESLTVTLGSDRSLTMADAMQFDTAYIRKVCMVALHFSGTCTIAFGAIAAPNDSDLLRLTLLPLLPQNGHSMSKRAAIAEKNRKIAKENLWRIETFLLACQRRIEVANAHNGLTDLSGHLRKANRFHSEPQFAQALKIAFVQTDGDHDIVIKVSGRLKRDRTLRCPDWTDGIQLYSSNWSAQHSDCNFLDLESPQGFLEFFTHFINAHRHDNENRTTATQ